MKYLMVKPKGLPEDATPCIMPILFPDFISHDQAVPNGYEPISAGFVNSMLDECYGKSDSLKLVAKKEDTVHLRTYLQMGESCLILSSFNYYD